MKLWTSSAISPQGNSYGLVAVLAETRHEAIARARAAIEADDDGGKYLPAQRYALNLLENLDTQMTEVPSGAVVDWDAVRPPR
jgi:hypothetical protein